MSNALVSGLTWFAVIGSGLIAGVFFIFSITIMPSLSKLPVTQGMATMQQINRTIVNPIFMVAFLGTGIVAVALGGMAFRELETGQGQWIL